MNIKEIDKKMDEFERRTYRCEECGDMVAWKKLTVVKRSKYVCGKCIVSYRIGELDDMAVACGVITNEERVIK